MHSLVLLCCYNISKLVQNLQMLHSLYLLCMCMYMYISVIQYQCIRVSLVVFFDVSVLSATRNVYTLNVGQLQHFRRYHIYVEDQCVQQFDIEPCATGTGSQNSQSTYESKSKYGRNLITFMPNNAFYLKCL